MIVRLQDNPRIIVKPEYQPVQITGNTYYNFIASGETVITQVQTGNLVDVTIYNPSGSSTTWGLIVGDITNQTDLVDYVNLQISGATSGLTSSWNEITDKPSWLSGTTLEVFQTGHTHSYNDLDDLPILFSGDYDDLTNKPDLSVYQAVSGMSIYLTGVTWNDVTNKPDLTLQSDFTGHTSDLTIHYPMSGISITESQISDLGNYALQADFTGHTSNTSIHYAQSAITITESQISDLGAYITGVTSVGSGTTVLKSATVVKSLTATNLTLNAQTNEVNIEAGSIAPKDFWTGTEAQYLALGSYDNNTLYFCTA
jgi:hypothetical protein